MLEDHREKSGVLILCRTVLPWVPASCKSYHGFELQIHMLQSKASNQTMTTSRRLVLKMHAKENEKGGGEKKSVKTEVGCLKRLHNLQ